MNELISSPLFGIFLSLMTFFIGSYIFKKTKISIFNPLLISIILTILILKLFNISYDDYMKGASSISFFLIPATVVLAVPLYKELETIKANAFVIFVAITVGSLSGIVTIFLLGKLFKLDNSITFSLIPKSITTPIGIEVSKSLGGITPLTVAAIIITGIIGAIFSPHLCKIFKIEDKIAVGLSIGTSTHAMGTSKALEMGETEGAMSSLSIGIAGLLTVIISPIVVYIFSYFF